VADAQVRLVNGRDHLCWPCLLCQNEVQVPLAAAPTSMPCPHCKQRIAVPEPLPATPGVPPELPRPSIVPPAEDIYHYADPQSPVISRSTEGRRRRRYRQDDEDRLVRQSGEDLETLMRASIVGMICSLAGLTLLLFAFGLGAIAQSMWHRTEVALVWVAFFMVLGSFVLCLLGTIFGGRGMNPLNTENRGLAITGLTCGIVGMVLGAIAGLFLFCAGLLWTTTQVPYWRRW
jgi:hypothetical protein